MLLKIENVEQEHLTDRKTDKTQTDKQTTISSADPKIFQMVWGLKVYYQSYVNQITSSYPPVWPQVLRIIIFLIIFFTITLYVFSFTTMHAMFPTDVSYRDMVILIQYLIQTFKEPKLMSVMSTVRKFNCNGGINPTLHRMHHGRIIFILRFQLSKTWSSVTSQRAGIINNTTVKISEHAFLHLIIG